MRECRCGCGTQVGNQWARGHNSLARRAERPDYVVTDSGCWEWQRERTKAGYGVCDPRFYGFPEVGSPRKSAKPNGKWRAFAHRVYYAKFVGPIPPHSEVLHSCGNRPCVNPDHLRAGSHAENMQDMVEHGRTRKGRVYADACKNGHDRTDPANIYISPTGTRACRKCRRLWAGREVT